MTAGTAPPTASRPAPAGNRRAGLRGDIEGLRAIAVMMVLLYHAGVPGISGGFAGVDVFFVISGYLITGLLVREAERDGRISIPRFYARRARRLLPAATLVLVATALAAWWLLPRGRHLETGGEILGATGYVVNWVLAAREVDYLAEDADPSLVQHYWSLSVEEQFYVVWPLLIILVLWLARRLGARVRPLLVLTLALVTVASFVWSVVHTADSPQLAYFVTTTRVWQLGAGAGLVLLTPALRRLSRPAAALLAWAGLAMIAATLVLVGPQTPWPGSAALLPTLGTAAVIAAGITSPHTPPARLLSRRPMLFLGAVSYGLYLWHWPALRLLAELRPDSGLATRLAVSALSILLAWATLRLVEDPIRFHPGLARDTASTLRLGALAMLLSASLGLSLLLTAPRLSDEVVLDDTVATPGAMSLVDPSTRAEEELELVPDPAEAVVHVERPAPDPDVADQDLSIAYREGCQVNQDSTELKPEDRCRFGDPEGDTTVALVGDSKMEHWSTALHLIGRTEGWRVQTYTKSACAFVDEGRDADCRDYNAALLARLTMEGPVPDIVLTSAGAGYGDLGGSMASMLERLAEAGAQVVVVADTPLPQPRGVPDEVTSYECLSRNRADWSPCWSDDDPASGDAILPEIADQLSAPYIDLNPWVCPAPEQLGGCAPVVGGIVVNRQGSHLTGTYVRSLTPLLHHHLVVAGVASTPLDQISWELADDPQKPD